MWYFRFRIETKDANVSRFLTFTYNDDHLPITEVVDDDGVIRYCCSVCPDDIDKMTKKMHNDHLKFRYWLSSEYTPEGHRPHYHALFWSDQRIDFEKYWKNGFILDLPANKGSMKYVAKYLLKGSNVPDGCLPNFRRMSRRPGIGHAFQYKGQHYLVTEGGVIPVGHYYRRRYLNSLNAKLREEIKESTKDYLLSRSCDEDLYNRYLHGTNAYYLDRPTFDEWVQKLYEKDLKAQIKINNKK